MLKAALNTVGAFNAPTRPPMPTEVARPSAPPLLRGWQEAHATVSSSDKTFVVKQLFAERYFVHIQGNGAGQRLDRFIKKRRTSGARRPKPDKQAQHGKCNRKLSAGLASLESQFKQYAIDHSKLPHQTEP